MSTDPTIIDPQSTGRRANTDNIFAWHFLLDSGMLRYLPGVHVEVGATYTADGPLSICVNGMHASIRPFDALQYAPGSLLCRVLLHGDRIHSSDKLCARYRTVLWMADAAPMLREFAIWCAEHALLAERARGIEPHADLFKGLETKRAWLHGQATDAELDEAVLAVGNVIADSGSTPWSTWEAAKSVRSAIIRNTACVAANAAAHNAAKSITAGSVYVSVYTTVDTLVCIPPAGNDTWDDAMSNAYAVQNTQLESTFFKLTPIGYTESTP